MPSKKPAPNTALLAEIREIREALAVSRGELDRVYRNIADASSRMASADEALFKAERTLVKFTKEIA